MKNIIYIVCFLLTSCSITDSLTEVNIDNKDCIGVRRFKVLQAIYHNTGLAYECFTPDCSDYYHNNLDFVLADKIGDDWYDGMIYEVPNDKCAVRKGVYKYKNKEGTMKTVSQIIFEYKNDYKSEEEHQNRIYEAKENIYSLCLLTFEDEKVKIDENYCECYGSSYIDNNGDAKAIQKECGKLPKILSHLVN